MIDIDKLTIGEAKEIARLTTNESKENPFSIGKKYLFRTVTHIDVGKVVNICGDFIILENASWIADTGRYHDCLSKGVFKEVEPYPDQVFLNMPTLIDAAPWPHDLPMEQYP